MGMIRVTDKMRERMDAGLSFMYTARDGHVWYIDSTLNFPFRQADFAESMYDAYDGSNFECGFPSLSMCQLAIEEGCPQWRGEGWYVIGNGDDVYPVRIGSIGELRERVSVVRDNYEKMGASWTVDYIGDREEGI